MGSEGSAAGGGGPQLQRPRLNKKDKMVCTAERRGTGGRRRRRGERRDVMEQYRKLRLVLPNINSRGKISKQVVVEEAILYIEELQRQLKDRLEETLEEEERKHWEEMEEVVEKEEMLEKKEMLEEEEEEILEKESLKLGQV